MRRDAERADPDGGLDHGKSILAFVGPDADNREPPARHPEPAGGLLNEASRIGGFVEEEDAGEEEEEDPNQPTGEAGHHHVTFADEEEEELQTESSAPDPPTKGEPVFSLIRRRYSWSSSDDDGNNAEDRGSASSKEDADEEVPAKHATPTELFEKEQVQQNTSRLGEQPSSSTATRGSLRSSATHASSSSATHASLRSSSTASSLPSYKDQVREERQQQQHQDEEEAIPMGYVDTGRRGSSAKFRPSSVVFADAQVIGGDGDGGGSHPRGGEENVVEISYDTADEPAGKEDRAASTSSYRRPLLIGALVLLLAGAAVGGACGAGVCGGGDSKAVSAEVSNANEGSTDPPFSSPPGLATDPPTNAPMMSPVTIAMIDFINNVTFAGTTVAYPPVTATPEELALQWLIEGDPTDYSSLSTATQLRLRQRYSLATLFYSTGGESWTTASNWLSGGISECSWFGVTCGSGNRVTEIALSENNLNGGFPADVALLTFLTEIDFSSNMNLLGPLPSSIGNLEFLTIFLVNFCSFQETLPEEIGSWTRLEEFHVNTNFFSGTLPSSIGQWTNLRVFQVGGKFLNGILPWILLYHN